MRIFGEKQRPMGPIDIAVLHDRLRDRKNVLLVERSVERSSTMSAGSKTHTLGHNRRVRALGVIVRNQPRNIGEHAGIRTPAGLRMGRHHLKVRALPMFAQS